MSTTLAIGGVVCMAAAVTWMMVGIVRAVEGYVSPDWHKAAVMVLAAVGIALFVLAG